MGDGGGELDVLQATGGFAFGVGEDFAVFGGDEGGDFVEARFEDFAEAEHDAGTAEGWLRRPLGEGGGGGGDGGVKFGAVGEGDEGLHLAGGGVIHFAGTAGGSGDGDTIDPVGDSARGGGGGGGDVRKDGGGHLGAPRQVL